MTQPASSASDGPSSLAAPQAEAAATPLGQAGSSHMVVRGLVKKFRDLRRGEFAAVDGVSFECHPGEIFCLLGLNGAGKTTTMRILSTVLRPSGGIAEVAGFNVVTAAPRVRQHIGYLSNSTALYDRMTAWEHVEYFGKLYGLQGPALAERLEAVFASLQMNEFRDLLVSKMSTGMRQKVSIARALVHNPPVLIFDEPTSGLDVLTARAVLEQVKALRQQGKCILYSTHILSEVEKLCDRLAIIHHGRLLVTGTMAEIKQRYAGISIEELFFQLLDEHAAPPA